MNSKLLIAVVVALAAVSVVDAGLRDRLAPTRTLNVAPFPHTFIARLQRTQFKPRIVSILWFGFQTWGFPRFRVQFFENDDTGASRFKFRFGLLHVAEYNDSTPDFQRSNIVVGSGIRLIGRGPEWTQIAYTGPDADGVRHAETSLTTTNRGTVTIGCKLAPRAVQSGNATLAANKIKFDLGISNFVYQRTGTKIAVLAVMNLKTGYRPPVQKVGAQSSGDSDDSDEINVDSGNGDGGRFAWVRKVYDSGNGRWLNVKTFTLRDDDTDYTGANTGTTGDVGDDDRQVDESSKLVVFVFDTNGQPTTLLWDPEIAIDDNASGRISASILVVLFAVVASLLA
jgi:hypothetical protein